MRAFIIALGLGLAACVSAQGAVDSQSPFSGQPAAQTQSQTPSPQSFTPIDVPAGAYRIDPRHTSVLFRIRHEGISWFTARFDTKDATLQLDPANPSQTHLTASVDATSVNTGLTNTAGERAFDHAIGNAIGAQATQQITFNSTAVERTGQNTARVTGDLTMNGQTHPATLEVTFGGAHNDIVRGGAVAIGFSAHGVIDRSQWGVTQWTAFAGNDVQIVIETEFTHS
ncbi:MAG: YceI family protein [Proteobacteria bacterium]|nr:YceI family protein [Pseudomonadota bacterium]